MKRLVVLLVPIFFAVFTVALGTGCGGGSGKSEVNTQPIQELKPGEAVDRREAMFPKSK